MKKILLSFCISTIVATTSFAMLTKHEERLARFQESAKQLSIAHDHAVAFYREILGRKENKQLPDKSIKSVIEAEITELKTQELKIGIEATCRENREKNGTSVQTSKGHIRVWQELLAHQIAIQERSLVARETLAVLTLQELTQMIEKAKQRNETAHAIQ